MDERMNGTSPGLLTRDVIQSEVDAACTAVAFKNPDVQADLQSSEI